MLPRPLATVLVAALLTSTTPCVARASSFYEGFIEKPWALSSLAEILALTVFAVLLARSRHRHLAAVALLGTLVWGAVRIWLDPIFDPLIGVMMRNTEMSLSLRVGYQIALLGLAVTPLAAALMTSGRAGHYAQRRWRRAVGPGYALLAAVLIITPEFMELTIF